MRPALTLTIPLANVSTHGPVPKGGIEPGETSGQAAVREAWEEAGTPPSLSGPSDDDRLIVLALGKGKKKRAAVWHVHVVQLSDEQLDADWPERKERQREWVTPRECLERIKAWSTDGTASQEVDPGSPVDAPGGQSSVKAEGTEKKQRKKEEKSGAMQMALRAFTDKYGWE